MLNGKLVKTITSDGLEHVGFFAEQKSDLAIFHSHGTAGDFYTHKFLEIEAEVLAKNNISFLTANNRGHDVYADIRKYSDGKVGWAIIGGGFEKFEDCLFDIKAWLDFLQKQGVKKVILQGHSLSQKILYYQDIKKDRSVVGQIHLSPQNDAGLMYFALGKEKYRKTNEKIKRLVNQGKEQTILPSKLSPVSPITSAQMYYDYLTEEGIGTLTPYHNPDSKNWQIIGRVKEPMLVVFGSTDIYMKPSVETATEIIRRKTKNTPNTTVKIIKGASHSYLGYEDTLAETILNWIQKTYLRR